MQGYLFKYANFLSGFRKRYFRLEGDVLLYYKDKGGRLKDTLYIRQTEVQVSQKEPLKLFLKAGIKKIELKAASIQEKVMWYNALTKARELSTKTPEEIKEERKSSLVMSSGKSGQSGGKSSKLEALPYFKEETLLDQKLNKIWSEQSNLEETVRQLKIQSAESGLGEFNILAEKIQEICFELKKAVTQAAIEIESNKYELIKILRDLKSKEASLERMKSVGSVNARAEFVTVKNHKEGDDHVDDQELMAEGIQGTPNKPKSYLESPLISGNRKIGPEDQNVSIDSDQHSYESFEDDVFYDAYQDQEEATVKKTKTNAESTKKGDPLQEEKHKPTSSQDEEEEKLPWVRDQLPVLRDPKKKFSIWSIIKDAIGKDLTKFTVPVFFNEPLSMLQKITEALEYEDLLVKAAKEPDPLIRLAHIAVFNVVQYCCSDERLLKPFNPILGETYEYIDKDGKYKYFAEQVSHHPPVSACHASSPYYEFYMNTAMKSSFGMKSMEFRPLGSAYVKLKLQNGEQELYYCERPNSLIHNIIMGKMWIEHHGNIEIINRTRNAKCKIKFHKAGWSKKTLNKIQATVFDDRGIEAISLEGRWNQSINMINLTNGSVQQIWERNPRLQLWAEQYHFTSYTLQLNHFPPGVKKRLPHTDSRFRPDQRALQLGQLKVAAAEKHRLEEKQRAARKKREKAKVKWESKYFVERVDQVSKLKYYEFNHKYWEDREKHNWSHLPNLFSKDTDDGSTKTDEMKAMRTESETQSELFQEE